MVPAVGGGASGGSGDDYSHGGNRDGGHGGSDCYDDADGSKTLNINSLIQQVFVENLPV